MIQFVKAWRHKLHCLRISAGISPLEDLSELILFMTFFTFTNVTWWKGNLAIFVNLFLIILILGWPGNFRMMLSMISRLSAKLLTSPGHLKRFKEGAISEKQSLKVVEIFLLLRISSFFQLELY